MAVFRRRQILLLDTQASYQATVLGIAPSSLLAYWPLTETSGTTASDVSGNARHGTYSGVTLAQIAGPGASMGSAGLWDGINDTCNVFSASLAAAFNKNEHTISVWAKVVSSAVWTDTAYRTVIGTGDSTAFATAQATIIKHNTNNNFSYSLQNTEYPRAFNSTAWFHAALVSSGNLTGVTYLNAVAEAIVKTQWTSGFDTARIGSRHGLFFWPGYIAHVAIWSTALSPAQITTLATAR